MTTWVIMPVFLEVWEYEMASAMLGAGFAHLSDASRCRVLRLVRPEVRAYLLLMSLQAVVTTNRRLGFWRLALRELGVIVAFEI